MAMNANGVYLEVFAKHWQHISYSILHDDDKTNAEVISKYIEIMTSLILKECETTSSFNAMMEYCDKKLVFETIFKRFNKVNLTSNIREYGFFLQLKMFRDLLNGLSKECLRGYKILSPLLHLLRESSLMKNETIGLVTIKILYQLTVMITRDSQLFHYVKFISNHDFKEPLLFVRLLIESIHRDKEIGRLSQEAMLLIFIYSKDEESDLVEYLCHRSDFSATLVSGLRGLYDSFPKSLEPLPDDWQQITPEFIATVPALKNTLQLLDFCSVILKMAHPKIQVDILDYFQTGFLSLVIGPSLHQGSTDENICHIAYLELFLRHLHHPSLTKLFLHFILTEKRDDYDVLESLIKGLESQTMLGVITFSLFRTMLSFHCEDVMFHIILRYLIPCTHLLTQKLRHTDLLSSTEDISLCSLKRNRLNQSIQQASNRNAAFNEDLSNSADQFLKLSFSSCSNIDTDPTSADLLNFKRNENLQRILSNSSFYSYLNSSAIYVNRRILATESWSFNYDGMYPPPQIFNMIECSSRISTLRYRFSSDSDLFDETKDTENSLSQVLNADPMGESISSLLLTSNERDDDQELASRQPPDSPIDYESKVKELCDPSPYRKDIYKLNYFTYDNDSINNDINEVVSVKKDNMHPLTHHVIKTDEIKLDSVLLTINENCSLTDFLVSLDLLETCGPVDWDLDWIVVTDLLIDHKVRSGEQPRQRQPSLVTLSSLELSSHDDNLSTKSITLTNERIFQKRLQAFDVSVYRHPAASKVSITLGPFLTILFQRLRTMQTNSVFMNLLVTGIITDLAAYPHPIIKNLILDIETILHPFLDKLYDILIEIKSCIMAQCRDISNWDSILISAYEYLYSRIDRSSDKCDIAHRKSSLSSPSMSSQPRKSSFSFLTGAKKTFTGPQYRFPMPNFVDSKRKRVTEVDSQNVRNLAYSWVILDEFCKELASLCQEHTQHCFF